jgi:hypothetical protein
MNEPYKLVPIPEGTHIEICPVCFAAAEIWRYSESPDDPTETAVMCSNGDMFGPQTNVDAGCLLMMPPKEFYFGTIREAVKYWNEYALALQQQRLQRTVNGFERNG